MLRSTAMSRTAGADRVDLLTDAMAAAGMSDGAYRIGPLAVDVTDGVAHLAGTQTIAGSTATMDRPFRFAVANSELPRDEALRQAVRPSVNPARALGLPDPTLTPAPPPIWWFSMRTSVLRPSCAAANGSQTLNN